MKDFQVFDFRFGFSTPKSPRVRFWDKWVGIKEVYWVSKKILRPRSYDARKPIFWEETFLIPTNLTQNLTLGRFRRAESESEVKNLAILHPDLEIKEKHAKTYIDLRSFSLNFEVWVKDFQVFDLRFGFSTPKSPRGQILRWGFKTFWSLNFGFPEVLEGPGSFRRVREAETKNLHQFSPKMLQRIPSYDRKTKKVNDYLNHDY